MEIQRHGLTEVYSPRELKDTVAHVIFIHGLFGHPYKTWTKAQSRSESPRPFSIRSSSSLFSPEKRHQSAEDRPSQKDDYPPLKNEELAIDEDEENLRLQGESRQSSASEAVFWPKTLLPSVIPNARIFTWGYDADVNGWLSSASQNNIHQHAGNLLVDLSDLRSNANERSIPLIFVVHSLGGVIVKDALGQSAVNGGTRRKYIAPATFGIIFLGTPHRGSKSASLGKIAYRIAEVATRSPNLQLLKGLERNSEILDRIGDSFIQIVDKHKIQLCTFREERETRKYLFFSIMAVDADSAKLGVASEEVSSIPSDHSNMTKFQSHDDIGFKRVSSQLRRWIEEINNPSGMTLEIQTDCLRSLDVSETRWRINEVRKAHENTFHWLFDPKVVSFHQWLRGDEGSNAPIFWIQGKPGSGKSTLMKFAMQDPRTLKLLENTAKNTWKLVAFFFHDRGSEIQRSLDGMMQEILHSILQQHPPLLGVITPLYLDLIKSQRTKVPRWDTLTLQTALLKIAQVRNPGVRLCLFLDALDEHGGDNEKLAMLLKEMVSDTENETVKIRVCLASRSWAVFTKHFGNCPGFAIHEHTVEDISSYITSRLAPDSLGSQHLLNPNQLAMIAARITEKSSGVFIWVRLVVDQLSKDIQDGTPFGNLEHRVMEMPPELEDLYAHTLRRIEGVYCDESYVMLQIAYCSISPLSLQTFMGCASHEENPAHIYASVTEITSLDTQLQRLASRTGGLLEAISSTSRPGTEGSRMDWQQQGYHVQFIHQTVKEYVGKYRHNLGLAQLSDHVQRRNGYFFLISPNANLDGWFGHTPFPAWLLPLRSNFFTYAKRLESSIDPSDYDHYFRILELTAATFRESDIDLWLASAPQRFREYIADYFSSVRGQPLGTSYACAFDVLAVAANLILYTTKGMNQTFPYYSRRRDRNIEIKIQKLRRCLLHVAVAGPDLVQSGSLDHCAMIESLVKLGWPVDGAEVNLPQESPPGDQDFYHPMTPLAYLLINKMLNDRTEERRLQIARTLLKLGANVNARIPTQTIVKIVGISLLEYCVRYDSAPFVRLLLQHGALEPYPSDYSLGDFAFLRGDKDITQALKDHGVSFILFTPRESPDLGIIPETLINISRRLSLMVPHGRAIESVEWQQSRVSDKNLRLN